MISSLPNLPMEWVYGDKIPFQESNLVEFKEVSVFSGLFRNKSSGSSGLPKYRETIIGFLNGGKGYLIMGIKNDGTIVGVENMTDEMVDKFKLWIDGSFNNLVYKNGKSIDPSKISIKFHMFPVLNHETEANVIVIEVVNQGKYMDIMTRSGTIVYRLNASNFKVCSEPVYRKKDVKGIIHSVQAQMQQMAAEKRKAIQSLQEKHKEEIDEILKSQSNEIRAYVEQVSQSLYEKYKIEPKDTWCSRVMRLFVGI
jgi:predicted HTH transcriptional regulator